MRIAALLGKSLREVERFDADEILWWEALYEVDPWGEQRQDLRFAMLCQTIAAIVTKPPPMSAFMLYPDGDGRAVSEPMSCDAMHAVMQTVRDGMTNGNNDR